MIRTVVELEKCTLEGETSSEKAMDAIGDMVFKLQMHISLHEAAVSTSANSKSFFEVFLHTVLYCKYKRVLPNLLKYVLDALEMLTEEMNQELNLTTSTALVDRDMGSEVVVRKEVGTQTERREERNYLKVQEEPMQCLIPLTQRQSKLIKRKYVPNIMSNNPKRQKVDMSDLTPLLQKAKFEPKLANSEPLSQLRRKTSALYKGTFGSRLFMARTAKHVSPTGQLSESLLSRINAKVIENSEAGKEAASEEREPEIVEYNKTRKGSM